MNELYKPTVHNLLVKGVPSQQCYLVSMKQTDVLLIQFTTYALPDGVNKGIDESIHALACCCSERIVVNCYFNHMLLHDLIHFLPTQKTFRHVRCYIQIHLPVHDGHQRMTETPSGCRSCICSSH